MSSERRKGDGWAIHPNGRGAVGHPSRPVGRVRFMDSQRVNLDGFAVENADLGLVALRSPHLPVTEVLRELLAGLA